MKIAITSGEPAGIGSDLLIQLAQHVSLHDTVVLADPEMLVERARQLDLPLHINLYDASLQHPSPPQQPPSIGQLQVLPVNCRTKVQSGKLDKQNAAYVLDMLTRATQGCLQGEFTAMVTGPIHKGIINDAGIPFTGHTEFLAGLCGNPLPVMMLATEGLRVALATTHLPLAQVSAALTQQRLIDIIEILHHDLQTKFGIIDPHILVCGLNPHAGEGGHLGMEEIEIIEPVLQSCKSKGMNLTGPLPADTLFTHKYLSTADAVLAMYHDQGLPVLKHMGFGKAVNITLGLPIIRTSVDHGTALDLAGSGKADTGSLQEALNTARLMSLAQTQA